MWGHGAREARGAREGVRGARQGSRESEEWDKEQVLIVWHHCMVPLYGTTVWCHCMVPLYGAIVWCHCMAPLYSTTVQRHCTAPLYGTIVLRHCMAPLYGTKEQGARGASHLVKLSLPDIVLLITLVYLCTSETSYTIVLSVLITILIVELDAVGTTSELWAKCPPKVSEPVMPCNYHSLYLNSATPVSLQMNISSVTAASLNINISRAMPVSQKINISSATPVLLH